MAIAINHVEIGSGNEKICLGTTRISKFYTVVMVKNWVLILVFDIVR